MRRRVVIIYRRFGTTYWSHLDGSRIRVFFSYSDSWPVKMGPIRCPETSVNNYHTTPCNVPEERRSHQHRGGSLKSLFILNNYNAINIVVYFSLLQSKFSISVVEGRMDFSVLFYTVTNFRKPGHSHVISRGIFAPHLGTVAPLKDGYRCPTDILTRLVDLCSYIKSYTAFSLIC
jgi:hypothetical protein